MAERADLIAQFTNIVSCNEQQAHFYLEANGWDLNVFNYLLIIHFDIDQLLSRVCFTYIIGSVKQLLRGTGGTECCFRLS